MTKYQIEIPDQLWEKFKSKATKDKTLNNHIMELIKKFVEEGS